MQKLLSDLAAIYDELFRKKKEEHRRSVSFGDHFTDRWERARREGFGEGTSCYDNVLILGNVKVGRNTWIGPNVVLDGGGGLEIGDFCSISAGVQIYTHDTVGWATSMGKEPAAYSPTRIGSGVYIGPNSVIARGIIIGDRAIIGALSFVNSNVPADAKFAGRPARSIAKGGDAE
jgi:acetyltransferase-like isoleucine patch superfamily enzyme